MTFDDAAPSVPDQPVADAAPAPAAPRFQHDLADLERRIASMELVDVAPPVAATDTTREAHDAGADARGAVLILAGIGGPDAVRQVLAGLPEGFPRPLLISQRLDGGRYDRLVQQMARATSLPVLLAESGTVATPGQVYIVPPELGITPADRGLRFVADAALLQALPADDSAVLLLSGSDPAEVDAALAQAAQGALVAGQAPDGCYDGAASNALVARGGVAAAPAELVQQLLQRWAPSLAS
jgi:chemotaxis response regulator CheB